MTDSNFCGGALSKCTTQCVNGFVRVRDCKTVVASRPVACA